MKAELQNARCCLNFQTEWFKDYLYYYEKKAQSPKMRENYSTMLEYRDEIRDIENVKHRAQLQREAQLSDAIRASQEAKVAASQE